MPLFSSLLPSPPLSLILLIHVIFPTFPSPVSLVLQCSAITEPAGLLELILNSELYTTLSKFDWIEFNRRSAKGSSENTFCVAFVC